MYFAVLSTCSLPLLRLSSACSLRSRLCVLHLPDDHYLPSSCCPLCWIHCHLLRCLFSLRRHCCLNLMPVPRFCCCCSNSSMLVHPSVLPPGQTSFVSLPSRLLCRAADFTVLLNSSSIRLRQFSACACLAVLEQRHAPGTSRCEPEHLQILTCYVHSLRYRNMFFHLQLFLLFLVQHHDLSFGRFSTHCCLVFVLAPRDRHDHHLQIASVPSVPRCLPDRSCEPHAVPVPHNDFFRGCFDAQLHAIFPIHIKFPFPQLTSLAPFADFPFSRSYAILPSRPTSNLVSHQSGWLSRQSRCSSNCPLDCSR